MYLIMISVLNLPFNQLIGIEPALVDSGYQLILADKQCYTNHLGTVHASALLSLAEAVTGHFLNHRFGNEGTFIPVVRRLNAEFSKPAKGAVYAKVDVSEEEVNQWLFLIRNKKRFIIAISFEVHNEEKQTVLSGKAEWFITKI
jgi:acyl-coenzyme A thioesterase PaaI-like protein